MKSVGRKPMQQLMLALAMLRRTLRLMVGVGDYATYVKHMRQYHPELPPLDEAAWFRQRMEARYGVSKDGAVKRCPC